LLNLLSCLESEYYPFYSDNSVIATLFTNYVWLLLFRFEILEITKGSLFRITNITFTHYVDKVAVFFCVLVTVLTPLPLTSQYFFALLATFKNFSYSIMTRSQLAATYCAEAQISIKRIQNFLLFEHQESSRAVIQRFVRRNTSFNKPLRTKCVPIIAVKNIDVSIGNCGILSDASFTALAGEVVGVAGAAGSGKSTFLQVILNEVEPQKGIVSVEGVVSYSAQEAWIFSACVRQNILFGQEMDLHKYQTVISACALEDDLSLFPYGDQTLVGERGVMLSGGQKARISLARAIYRNADIYLLDDPLSAVDGHVAMHIFNECILGYLKDKCVVLVTHQVKFLTNVDKVYFIEEGKFVRSENLNKINSLTYEKKTETIDLVKFGTVSEVKEHRSTEAQSQNMYKKYCFARHWSFSVLILIMLGFTQLLLSISDFFVAIWINLTQERRHSTPSVIKNLLPSDIFLYIYSALVVILVLSKHLLAVTYLKYCMSVSKKLHGGLLNTVLFAPMQFFNDHSSGRILNRFSKDIGCIDEIIPAVLFEVINCLFVTIGIFVVISILNYWLILPTLVLLVLFYMFAILFKPTNKCIRRTDGIG
jgi:ATP-binding cassette subfamily C (CFTR/MRP) protein 4